MESPKKTTITKYFKIGTVFSASIVILIYFLLNYYTLAIIERGPKLYILLFILEIIFLFVAIILGFLWIQKAYGFKRSKFYLIGISLCFIIILAGIIK